MKKPSLSTTARIGPSGGSVGTSCSAFSASRSLFLVVTMLERLPIFRSTSDPRCKVLALRRASKAGAPLSTLGGRGIRSVGG
eukprot:3112572-Rhodomonas_salina.3